MADEEGITFFVGEPHEALGSKETHWVIKNKNMKVKGRLVCKRKTIMESGAKG